MATTTLDGRLDKGVTEMARNDRVYISAATLLDGIRPTGVPGLWVDPGSRSGELIEVLDTLGEKMAAETGTGSFRIPYCGDESWLWTRRQRNSRCEVLGAAVFRKKTDRDMPGTYLALSWVWMRPGARREGRLTQAWPLFVERYRRFTVLKPVSDALDAFLCRQPREDGRSSNGSTVSVFGQSGERHQEGYASAFCAACGLVDKVRSLGGELSVPAPGRLRCIARLGTVGNDLLAALRMQRSAVLEVLGCEAAGGRVSSIGDSG